MQYSLLTKYELGLAVDIMSEAFEIDPLVKYISEDTRLSRSLYKMLMPFYFMHGEVWINSEKNTVLMCLTPKTSQKEFKPNPFNLCELVVKFGISSLVRSIQLAKITHQFRPTDPHYYIFSIGTTETGRNKGHAGEILRFFMNRAKREGAKLYGENTNPELNTGLYTYLGFDCSDPVPLTPEGPYFIPTFLNS